MPMRVVIIGKSGQIAQALTAHLLATGHDVSVLARPGIDLAQPETILPAIARLQPDMIINPAAYTAVDKAETEPDHAMRINRDGAKAVAEAAKAVDAALVHLSTDYVFDGTKHTPYVETDGVSPLGQYGRSKQAGEMAVMQACARSVVLRTSWVCSPHGHNFVKTMLRLASERPELRVVSDQFGAPTFAADIAAGIADMLPLLGKNAPPERFGMFHMTNAGRTNWHGFAQAIMQGASQRGGVSVPIKAISAADYPTPAKRPANSCLSNEKLGRIHGISLPDWHVGLEHCLDALMGPVPIP